MLNQKRRIRQLHNPAWKYRIAGIGTAVPVYGMDGASQG